MNSRTHHTDQDVLGSLRRLERATRLRTLRTGVRSLKQAVASGESPVLSFEAEGANNGQSTFSRQVLLNELEQIERTKTLTRARYYLGRLQRSLVEVSTGKINDINLRRWKEYHGILTDSLWLVDKRDGSGGHSAWYWGNFIPQIPHQLMLRYTKAGEWVLDGFAGSGTTLLECQRLGRNCLGIELQASVAKKVRTLLKSKPAHGNPTTLALEVGDSRVVNVRHLLREHQADSVQLLILHPPYHNIIQFSKNRRDLSNARSPQAFAAQFGRVIDNLTPVLDNGRMLAVVIGDKYEKGEWIPLGFLLMNEVLKREYRLKSIVVKNFDETAGKRSQKELWRFRALAGGFYVFKHEYIFIFQKHEREGGTSHGHHPRST